MFGQPHDYAKFYEIHLKKSTGPSVLECELETVLNCVYIQYPLMLYCVYDRVTNVH